MTYTYECPTCGWQGDQQRAVADRDYTARCGGCGLAAFRIFTPTTNFVIPAHFSQVSTASWMLPETDKGWEDASKNATVRPQKRKSFREAITPHL